MPALKDILLTDSTRPNLIGDCVALIDREVDGKSGLSGVAVKGAYALVKKVKPGIIQEAVDRLLNDFVAHLEPFFAQFQEKGGGTFASFLEGKAAEVANALLGVTDTRIQGTKHKSIQKAYEKLRPTGEKHVQAAVPGVGRVVQKYL